MRLGFWKTDDKSYGRNVYVVAIDDRPIAWLMRNHCGRPALSCIDNDPHYWDVMVFDGAVDGFEDLGLQHLGSHCTTLADAKESIRRMVARAGRSEATDA